MGPDEADDLKAVTSDIAADAARLQAIEREKATLRAGDPRLLELAREAERIGKILGPKTTLERELVDGTSGA